MKPSAFLAPLLWPLSWLFGAAVGLRNALYDRGLRGVQRLPVPVISVGNLSVGGTGKTPLVMLLARRLHGAGRRPAVVLRGYGGSNARLPGGPPLVVADGRGFPACTDATIAGDEAILLATHLAEVPVVVAADRVRGGQEAVHSCGADVILLDDGFQHRALHRDFDLVALDAAAVPFPGRLLPAGRLREPVSSLGRSQAVVLTQAADDGAAAQACAFLQRLAPALPVHRSRHRATCLRWVGPGLAPAPALEELRGMPVAAFAGLARPQALRDSLIALGARVVQFTPLRDHHPFAPGQVAELVAAGRAAGARLVITTAKDAARMDRSQDAGPLAILEIEVEVEDLDDLLLRLLDLRPGKPSVEASR